MSLSQPAPRAAGSREEGTQSRFDGIRRSVNQLFSGHSMVSRASQRAGGIPDSPKSPRPILGLPDLPSTRLNVPYLSRSNSMISTRTVNSSFSSRPNREPITTPYHRPIVLDISDRQDELNNPPAIVVDEQIQHSDSRFVGVDPAELHLAHLAAAGRRHGRRKSKSKTRICGLNVRSRKVRVKLVSCIISGLFLCLILTIYLALALSNRSEGEEFHVLLILIILITTIVFCHSLIRLCMLTLHPLTDTVPMVGPDEYANPVVPIRVVLARDEEAAGVESEATKFPPPAYGLWRESVRVDPNRLFWQRNETATRDLEAVRTAVTSGSRPVTARPPSYISDDGIEYVVEAAPRSIAPVGDDCLPPHPSERGRSLPIVHA